MSNTDEGLKEYLDPRSKYAGYETEVTISIRHNEGDHEGIAPDWRVDWERTYSGDEAQAVMGAVLWRSRLREIEDAARLFAMYTEQGFIRCKFCNGENPTDGIDGLAELEAALGAAKEDAP